MNWYNKTLKYAASPKNIINNWKVDDPFLKFFIYTYEPLIDLSKVKSKEDLKKYIQSDLIPALKEKIDQKNPNSYYKKTMSDEEILAEFNEHPNDPLMQQARIVYKNDPKAAKKVLLNVINKDKEESFNQWWNHIEENYKDNPAFLYSILNPIFESSPATQKNGPPPVNPEAIGVIKDEIGTKGVSQMNVFKKFNKISYELDKKNVSDSIKVDDNKNWIKVNSKLSDPTNYKENKEKLKRFATDSGWCIAGEQYADKYLSIGDFWLYFENEKPKVAIRLSGDKKVEEIRGLRNEQKTLDPYWEQVITFLHNSDLDYENNSFYQQLRKIMEKNINLVELRKTDPQRFEQIYQGLLNSIKKDPKQLGQVSDINKQAFPELVQTAATGYEARMHILLDQVEKIPPTGNEYQRRFGKFQDEFNDIPTEVKPYLSKEIEGRLVSVHKGAFLRNPLEYEYFPEDMKATITPQEKRIAWTHYVGNDPYRFNDLRIPQEIRQDIPIEPIVEGWNRLVDLNINHVDNIPKFVLKLLPENYIENKVIEDFKRYPCNRDRHGYDKLKRVQEMGLMTEEQIVAVYVDAVHRNANIFRYLPPQYKELVKGNIDDISPLAQKNLTEVMADASYFNSIVDPDVKNYLLTNHTAQLVNSFVKLKQKYGRDLNGYWKNVPIELQPHMPEPIKEEVANFYLPYVQRNPDFLNKVPVSLHPYITNKLAMSLNWYKQAQGDNWIITKLVSMFGIAAVLSLVGVYGLQGLAYQYQSNPQQIEQQAKQVQQSSQASPEPAWVEEQPTFQNNIVEEKQQNESFNIKDVAKMIERHEGKRNKVYLDSFGIPTIGIGFNLNRDDARERLSSVGLDYNQIRNGSQSLTDEQVYHFFKEDLNEAIQTAQSFLPNFYEHPAKIQEVIINMAFNLGPNKLAEFKKFKEALLDKDYRTAADEMINSEWHGQVGDRSIELENIMNRGF